MRPRTREVHPQRRPFPASFEMNWQQRPNGHLIYLRRTTDKGVINLLGHGWGIDPGGSIGWFTRK